MPQDLADAMLNSLSRLQVITKDGDERKLSCGLGEERTVQFNVPCKLQ